MKYFLVVFLGVCLAPATFGDGPVAVTQRGLFGGVTNLLNNIPVVGAVTKPVVATVNRIVPVENIVNTVTSPVTNLVSTVTTPVTGLVGLALAPVGLATLASQLNNIQINTTAIAERIADFIRENNLTPAIQQIVDGVRELNTSST